MQSAHRDRVKVLLLALALDALLGEPPNVLHPVAWLGRVLSWFEAVAPRRRWPRLVYGLGVALLLPLVVGAAGARVERALPWWLQAVVLKPTFAGRALLEASARVEAPLRAGELEIARNSLHALVSRDTRDLDESLIAAGAIESLAENLSDSWVAPLLAYALFGAAGAYAYRAVNTADAMWGYHSARYEHLGKAAARLDDALNLLPSRLSALLVVNSARAFRTWRSDAVLTESPNAGQPMSAMAGALDIRLEKIDHYVLNSSASPPVVDDLPRARSLVRRAMFVSAIVCLMVSALRR